MANSRTTRRVTDGDSSASPAATSRIARSSSAGLVSLMRKPLAPCRSASKTYSSSSNVVSTITRVPASSGVGDDPPGRLDAVDAGHPHVHQHDVRARARAASRDRASPSAASPTTRQAVLALDQRAQPEPDQVLVVGDQHPDHVGHAGSPRSARLRATGSRACTRKPPPAVGPGLNVPPSAVTRSRMPARPCPRVGAAGTGRGPAGVGHLDRTASGR